MNILETAQARLTETAGGAAQLPYVTLAKKMYAAIKRSGVKCTVLKLSKDLAEFDMLVDYEGSVLSPLIRAWAQSLAQATDTKMVSFTDDGKGYMFSPIGGQARAFITSQVDGGPAGSLRVLVRRSRGAGV